MAREYGSGEQWLFPCRVATTANIALSGASPIIDGIQTNNGDRLLVKNQTAPAENGIWVVGATFTRATDADTAAKVDRGTKVRVNFGTQGAMRIFTQLDTVTTVGTDPQTWRVQTTIDTGGLFTYPAAGQRTVGQLYYNLNQRGLSIWDGLKWTYISATVWTATSATRPAATYIEDGGIVYETDTGLAFIAVSGAWVAFGSGGGGGGAPTGAAGGDLTGTYPNPTIGAGKVTSPQIATAGVKYTNMNLDTMDLAAANASMRSLGTGLYQAAPGNHAHDVTTTSITGTLPVTKGGTGNSSAFIAGGVLTAVNGGLVGTTPAGTAGQVFISQGSSGPMWDVLDLSDLPEAWVKKSVRAATTSANITLSGTQTIDNVALVANDRVLVKNQTTPAQNGIYVVATGAWVRATDADTSSKIAGAAVNVDLGVMNFGALYTTGFRPTDTLGTTAMTWAPVGSTQSTLTVSTDITVAGDSLPRGISGGGLAQIVADSATANSTTAVDVAGLSVTFPTITGRRYKATFFGMMESTVAGDRPGILLREGTATQLQVTTLAVPQANSGYGASIAFVYTAPTSVSRTFKISILRSSGSGLVKVSAAAASPAQLIIEDIGV